MKKATITIFFIFFAFLYLRAQTPSQFKYQAVLRDASGGILSERSVAVSVSILQGSPTGESVFYETHNITTTAQGLINLNIGSINDMSSIDWGSSNYFIEIEVDGTIMGTSQLLSVPYAIHAKTVENINEVDGDINNEIQTLSISNDTIYLSNGGFVKLPVQVLNESLKITETITSASDGFSFDGAISIVVTGGTPPYSYAWARIGSSVGLYKYTNEITELKTGYYEVFVWDNSGLSASKSIYVDHNAPKIILESITPTCANANNGAIDISVSGGTPPYKFYWYLFDFDGHFRKDFSSNEDVIGLSAGEYSLQVVDANGVKSDISDANVGTFNVPAYKPTVSFNVISPCSGDDGSIQVSIPAEEPNQPFTYEWTKNNRSYVISLNKDLTNQPAGYYSLTITNSLGCISEKRMVTISGIATPPINYNITKPCSGESNGAIDITILSSESFTYQWSTSQDFSNIVSTSEDLASIGEGQYYLRLTNSGGCNTEPINFYLNSFYPNFNVEIENASSSLATDGEIHLISNSPVNINDYQYDYEWREYFSDTGTEGSILSTNSYLVNVAPGDYSLRITSENGCTVEYLPFVTVNNN